MDSTLTKEPILRRILPDLGKRTLVMGILNVTPDSFSDGGRYTDPKRALEHAQGMLESGADIIDVGAESTRPGAVPLSFAEEWERLEPLFAQLRAAIRAPISVDTYKPEIARRAVAMGADLVNDVWGGRRAPAMYETVAALGVPYVMMHNSTDRPAFTGADIAAAVRDELLRAAARAVAAGVARDAIILDPGIGFGKTFAQNMALVNRLDVLKATGHRVLVGTSRKSFIGRALGLDVQERVEGTAATVAVAVARGVDAVRVHDVKEMARVARMTDQLVR